jgi:hypothetical protein
LNKTRGQLARLQIHPGYFPNLNRNLNPNHNFKPIRITMMIRIKTRSFHLAAGV